MAPGWRLTCLQSISRVSVCTGRGDDAVDRLRSGLGRRKANATYVSSCALCPPDNLVHALLACLYASRNVNVAIGG